MNAQTRERYRRQCLAQAQSQAQAKADDNALPLIKGIAIEYNTISREYPNGGGHVTYRSGCFRDALANLERQPVRVQIGHAGYFDMGDTTDWLALTDTTDWLEFAFQPTPGRGEELIELMRAGHLTKVSVHTNLDPSVADVQFGKHDGKPLTIVRQAPLREISFTSKPAFPGTFAFIAGEADMPDSPQPLNGSLSHNTRLYAIAAH